MSDDWAILAGDVTPWPSRDAMASLLRSAGLTADVGRYSVRVRDCARFAFQEYGGDRGEPTIDASAVSVDALVHDASLVSNALTRAGVRHRFEVYDAGDVLRAYLHHDWPRGDDA
ncbi:MAG TPA: hypothetical protein VGB53_11020 [Rubricoccaceae bacterium]|jgi:hypothetical protein